MPTGPVQQRHSSKARTAEGGVADVANADADSVVRFGDEARKANEEIADADGVHLIEPAAAFFFGVAPVVTAMVSASVVAAAFTLVIFVVVVVVVASVLSKLWLNESGD